LARGDREVPARDLGEMVMHELRWWIRWLISALLRCIAVFLM